jgi:hypothetical protein
VVELVFLVPHQEMALPEVREVVPQVPLVAEEERAQPDRVTQAGTMPVAVAALVVLETMGLVLGPQQVALVFRLQLLVLLLPVRAEEVVHHQLAVQHPAVVAAAALVYSLVLAEMEALIQVAVAEDFGVVAMARRELAALAL